MNSSGERRSWRRHSCNIVWRTFCPGWGSRKMTTFGLRVALRNDRAEPAWPFGRCSRASRDHAESVSTGPEGVTETLPEIRTHTCVRANRARSRAERRAESGRRAESVRGRKEGSMAYYKLRMDVWCGWDPADSDLEEIAQNISAGDAICTRRVVIAAVDRPQEHRR